MNAQDEINEALSGLERTVHDKVGPLNARIDELELQLNRKGLGGSGPSRVDVEGLRAYVARGEIQNSMQTGSGPDGGYTVQSEMASSIFQVMREINPMREVARVVTITSDAFEEVQDRGDSAGATWVSETEARPTTANPKLGKLRIQAREIYAQPEVTTTLLEDSSVDLAAWLTEKLARDFAIAEGTAFVTGTGNDEPRGFTTYATAATPDASRAWGTWEHIVTGAAGAFPTVSGMNAGDPSALFDTIAALKPQYRARARWYMNRSTWSVVRKLRDNEGRFLLTPGLNGDPDNLLGFPVTTIEDLPDIGSDSLSIWFGDMSRAYTIVQRRTMTMLRDDVTNKPFVRLYSRMRLGGDAADFHSLKAVKFSA